MQDDGRHTVLVVEDDRLLRATLERGLRTAGYAVEAVETGADAVHRAAELGPDVIVLDIGLPDADGRDVCQALRAQGCTSGIVFLTARDHTEDLLSGFAAGGDDFVRKPFAFAELLARIGGVLRRLPNGSAATQETVDDGSPRLRLDPAKHTIRYGTAETSLTPTELRLLACLLARRDEVVRRGALVSAAWPGSGQVSDNTLDQYVTRARKRLREIGFEGALENVRGVGFRLH
ncbi:response regulator transcription factor [Spongisporangium articulatum]|uniref:Response regulator transcription factor n=1 Tax=Spongisporangium articulatum TaxID=3362603 RepID=A0ABW8ARZ4_9ACTN